MAEASPDAVEQSARAYSNDLTQVIQQLNSRFGRLPTENEVLRFVWGSRESRQKIWDERGLPENQR